jgi:hypothetical protein
MRSVQSHYKMTDADKIQVGLYTRSVLKFTVAHHLRSL